MHNVHIRQEFPARPDQEANDEVERRGAARDQRSCFIPIIDPLLGPTKTLPRDRSNRLLGVAVTRDENPRHRDKRSITAHRCTIAQVTVSFVSPSRRRRKTRLAAMMGVRINRAISTEPGPRELNARTESHNEAENIPAISPATTRWPKTTAFEESRWAKQEQNPPHRPPP